MRLQVYVLPTGMSFGSLDFLKLLFHAESTDLVRQSYWKKGIQDPRDVLI